MFLMEPKSSTVLADARVIICKSSHEVIRSVGDANGSLRLEEIDDAFHEEPGLCEPPKIARAIRGPTGTHQCCDSFSDILTHLDLYGGMDGTGGG